MSQHPVLTKENYTATLAGLWALADLVEEAPIGDMLSMAARAESLGGALDPTLYRSKIDALMEDIEMLRALAPVQATMQRIKRRRSVAPPAGVTP